MKTKTYTLKLADLMNELAHLAFGEVFGELDEMDCVVLTEEGQFSVASEEGMRIACEEGWGHDYCVVARKDSPIRAINLDRAQGWCDWLMCAFAAGYAEGGEYDAAKVIFDFGEEKKLFSNIKIMRCKKS